LLPQVNKNVYLKGRLGGDGVALMAAFKSWFQPSVAVAAAVERSFITGKMRTGLTVQVSSVLSLEPSISLQDRVELGFSVHGVQDINAATKVVSCTVPV
jgi:hypothetical protein